MSIDVAALAKSIFESVKSGAGKFLEDHKDAQAFVVDRAKRLAQLTFDLTVTSDDTAKARILEQMDIVGQSVENELSAVAVDAAVVSRVQFEAAVKSVFSFVVKALPTVLTAL